MKPLADDPIVSPRVREFCREQERRQAETQRVIEDAKQRAANGEGATMAAVAQGIGRSGRRTLDSVREYEAEPLEPADQAAQNMAHMLLQQAFANRR